jgi:DNA-binding LytR/AlgR family response regulator
MYIPSNKNNEEHIILLETEEVIVPVSTDRIWMVSIIGDETLVIFTIEKSITLSRFTEKNLFELTNAGLIRINPGNYINPEYIRKYKISDKEVELQNGKTVTVSDEYSKNLLQYFNMYL